MRFGSNEVLRVTAGGFDKCISRLYAPGFLSFFHHAQGDAIFHTAARIEEFDFGINFGLNAQALWDFIQPHERRVANQLRHRLSDRGVGGGLAG